MDIPAGRRSAEADVGFGCQEGAQNCGDCGRLRLPGFWLALFAESEHHLATVLATGLPILAQGFRFSRALDAESATRYLAGEMRLVA